MDIDRSLGPRTVLEGHVMAPVMINNPKKGKGIPIQNVSWRLAAAGVFSGVCSLLIILKLVSSVFDMLDMFDMFDHLDISKF